MRNSRIIQPPLGTPINRSHPLSQGLVGCWLLNEGGGLKARDSTRINVTDGVLTNGPIYKQTARGNAVLFDGSDDFITVPNNSNTQTFNAISICFWVNVVSFIHSINQIVMKNNANTSFAGVYVTNTGAIVNQLNTGASFTSAITLSLGSWYHVACTKNKDNSTPNCLTYINGVLDSVTGFETLANSTSTTALTFGTDAVNAGRQANILLQDVKIYNRALNQSEVRKLFTEPYSMFQNRDKKC